MIKVGFEPFLECSSRGDKRFSAFYAKIKSLGYKSIEELYQAKKRFADGSTGLSPQAAKGRKAVNMPECAVYYSQLWDIYFKENPRLLDIIKKYNGFSDMFGRPGCQCQAIEIYRIRKEIK